MADVIKVHLSGWRYSSPAPLDSVDVQAFITAMRTYATSVLGVDPPTIDSPENSQSIRFTFNVGGD